MINYKSKDFSFFLGGFVILVYLIVRAVKVPMTCDEVKTCLEYSRDSFSQIVSYSRSAVPNNHILHTLLVKFFTNIFGMTALVCRIPNLLGFIVYFYFSYKITNGFNKNGLIDNGLIDNRQKNQASVIQSSVSLLLLVGNPYFLDFFSLARGYGLACAFMMSSIYFALQYLKTQKNKPIFFSALFGVLSVYTNFTTLNFYVALCFLLGVFIIIERKNFFQLAILFAFTVLLAALSFLPITRMRATNQFVFWGNKGFYEDTFKSLTDSLMYGSSYFGAHTIAFFRIIALFLLFLVGVFCVLDFRKNKLLAYQTPFVFAFILLVTTVVVNISQYYIVHTPYLQTRTALFFFPLAALPIALLFSNLYEKNKKILNVVALVAGLPLAYHFFSHINTHSCYEWWYDSDTKKVLKYLEKEYQNDPEKKKIKLATYSWMMPSFLFHIEEEGREWWINVPESNGKIHPAGMNYYFTFDSEVPALKDQFDVVKKLGGRVLMKRKVLK